MASMIEITCACGCKRKKMVRVSDVKRGWGKYFSKSCKAKAQEKRTGQYADLIHSKKPKKKQRRQNTGLLGLLDRKIASAEVLCVDDDFYSENDVREHMGDL